MEAAHVSKESFCPQALPFSELAEERERLPGWTSSRDMETADGKESFSKKKVRMENEGCLCRVTGEERQGDGLTSGLWGLYQEILFSICSFFETLRWMKRTKKKMERARKRRYQQSQTRRKRDRESASHRLHLILDLLLDHGFVFFPVSLFFVLFFPLPSLPFSRHEDYEATRHSDS